MGVLAVPDVPVHGFPCDAETGEWVIAAGRGIREDMWTFSLKQIVEKSFLTAPYNTTP